MSFFHGEYFFFFVSLCWQLWCHTQVDCGAPPKWLSNFHHNIHIFFQQYSLLLMVFFFFLLHIEIINYESSPNCVYIKYMYIYIYCNEFNFTRASRVSSSPNSRIIKIRVLWNLFSWREMISSLFVGVFFFYVRTGAHRLMILFRFGHNKTAV